MVTSHDQENSECSHDSVTEVVDGEGEAHEANADQETKLEENIQVIVNFQSLKCYDNTCSWKPRFCYGYYIQCNILYLNAKH